MKPAENVPDLLNENRKIAIELAEGVISMLDVIAQHFGIPALDLAMATLPEVSLQLSADGVREQAAARTYLDLKGAVSLSDICRGTYAYPAPTLRCVAQEIQRRERRAQYTANAPLLMRILVEWTQREIATITLLQISRRRKPAIQAMLQKTVQLNKSPQEHNISTPKLQFTKGFIYEYEQQRS